MNEENKSNYVLDIIKNRRTIRAYREEHLKQKEIDTIINSAMRAPTAGNLMLYSIIQVDDQNIKDKLVKTCDNQPHIAQAPLVLLFVADLQRMWDFFEVSKVPELCRKRDEVFNTPEEADLMLACCDALIAAQNSVIAAESLGIGSCYIGDIMENFETHSEMFNLPKWVFPVTLLCFGYPKRSKTKILLSKRFPQKFIHFKNKYKRFDEESFSEMFQNINRNYNIDFAENLGHQLYYGKLNADFFKEMRRSVKVALKNWKNRNL